MHKAVLDAVFEAATRHGGIFWVRRQGHLRRLPRAFAGPEAFAAFRAIKAAFDPRNRLNPGKLMAERGARYTVSGSPLRAMHSPLGDPFEKAYDCNGNALCLNYAVPRCAPCSRSAPSRRHSPEGPRRGVARLAQARQSGTATKAMEQAVYDAMSGCSAANRTSQCRTHAHIP